MPCRNSIVVVHSNETGSRPGSLKGLSRTLKDACTVLREPRRSNAQRLPDKVISIDEAYPSSSRDYRIRLNAYNRLSGAGPAHCEVGRVREAVH